MTKDIVHQLIRTMSRTEKAYFKKYARKQQREKDDFYFKLFDAIDKQKEYDGNQLLKKFKAKKLSKKQLSISKHYLYNLIISTLREYQEGKNVTSQLHESIETVKLLYERELPQQALKTLQKAKKIAEKHEAFLYLMILQEIEEEILRVKMFPEIKQYIETGFEEELAVNKLWINLRKHRYIATKTSYWGRQQYSSRDEASDISTDKLLDIIENAEAPLSNKAQILHYHALIDYYNQKGNFDQIAELLKAQARLLEENPTLVAQNMLSYISVLNNLGVNQLLSKDYTGLLETAKKFKTLKGQTIYEEVQIFESYAQTLLVYISYNKETADLTEELKQIELDYKKMLNNLGADFKVIIAYGLGSAYFWNKQFNECLDWMTKTQELCRKHMMPDLKIASRLISLIAHYELNHKYYLSNANETMYSFLSHKGKLYKMEAALLKTLRSLSKLANDKEAKKIFKDFRENLLVLANDPFEEGAFRSFDFFRWVDSK